MSSSVPKLPRGLGECGQERRRQFLARGFVYSETALAAVVVAEELAARDRGWGIGMLGAIGAMGHGLSSIGFASARSSPSRA